jgi:hypothetical protein
VGFLDLLFSSNSSLLLQWLGQFFRTHTLCGGRIGNVPFAGKVSGCMYCSKLMVWEVEISLSELLVYVYILKFISTFSTSLPLFFFKIFEWNVMCQVLKYSIIIIFGVRNSCVHKYRSPGAGSAKK